MAAVNLEGPIEHIHSRGPVGGIIATLVDIQTRLRFRVVARSTIFFGGVVVGESIRLTGTLEVHGVYGPQVQASELTLTLPTGAAVAKLLAKHPAFSFIGPRRAAKLDKALTQSHPNWTPELELLLHAGLNSRLASLCARTWAAYARAVEVGMACAPLGLRESTKAHLPRLWPEPSLHIQTNPYTLTGLTRWEVVDQFGLNSGHGPTSQARLLGACAAAFCSRGFRTHWALTDTQLRQHLTRSLGNAALASQALDVGLATGRLVRVGDHGLQDVGAAALTRAIAQALFATSRTSTVGEPQRKVRLILLDGHSCIAGSRLVAASLPDALHIVPFAGLIDTEFSQALLVDAISQSEASDRTPEAAVVHLADALDPLVFNRLLQAPRLRIISTLVFTGFSPSAELGETVFSSLVCVSPLDIETASRTRGDELKLSTMARPTSNLKADLPARVLRVSGTREALDEAVAQYREAVQGLGQTAVVLAERESTCRVINGWLHNEHIEYQRHTAQSRPEQLLQPTKVGRYTSVDHTEPVRVVATSLRDRLIRGLPIRLAALALPTNSPWSAGQARSACSWPTRALDLGYCATLKTASLSSWETVVLLVLRSAGLTRNTFQRAASLAGRRVVVVCAQTCEAGDFQSGDSEHRVSPFTEALRTAIEELP